MDAMRGDATLFTRNDEVEAAWRIIDPILEAWAKDDGAAAAVRGRLRAARGGGRDPARRARAGGRSEPLDDRRRLGASRTRRRRRSRRRCAQLLNERHAEDEAYVPARVLNLVVVVDREWRGEIANRLERVGRYHPSRTILCAVERRAHHARRDVATIATDGATPKPGEIALLPRARS